MISFLWEVVVPFICEGPSARFARADAPHIPSMLNDILYVHCVAVAVSPNPGQLDVSVGPCSDIEEFHAPTTLLIC